MTAPVGLEFTGLRELNTALARLGVPDDAVKDAMQNAGELVQREAWRLMPVRTGAMARTLKVNRAKNKLIVSVGNNTTVPYAYTFHAVALGKSRGGFTFRVGPYSRRGRPVTGYKAARRITNRPFLYTAFERKKADMYRSYVTAIDRLCKEFSNG